MERVFSLEVWLRTGGIRSLATVVADSSNPTSVDSRGCLCSCSIIISWVFPKGLSGRLEQLVHDNAAVFKNAGVVEVTVAERRVFPCTQQEVGSTLSSINKI